LIQNEEGNPIIKLIDFGLSKKIKNPNYETEIKTASIGTL